MKTLFAVSMLIALPSYGQTLEEWTQQKETQIKYLLQQIAANKVYIEYIENGYGIARKGLNIIQKIKKGDFDLHRDFIASLSNINPEIKSYVRVGDIITYQARIVKRINNTLRNLKESNQFTADELDYNKSVFEKLLDECLKNIDELFLVITSGELEMKDDERINRIDQLYLDMQEKYCFCESFSKECSVLAVQRLSEQLEINMSRKINGLE